MKTRTKLNEQNSPSDSRAFSGNNKPTKTDVGLSSVDNVKQYSASNPPPIP